MVKIEKIKGGEVFIVKNTSDDDKKVTIYTEGSKRLKAYRRIKAKKVTYVDKYIDNDQCITYNAPGQSVTLFLGATISLEDQKYLF